MSDPVPGSSRSFPSNNPNRRRELLSALLAIPVSTVPPPRAVGTSALCGDRYDDPRYVHHAWEEGKWFGRAEGGKLVYGVEGKPIKLDEISP